MAPIKAGKPAPNKAKATKKPAPVKKVAGKVVSDAPKTTSDPEATDWERIELDFRAGIKSLREMAKGSGVSHVTISKRAQRLGWLRHPRAEPVALERDELDRAGFVYVVYLDDSACERFYKIGMSAAFSSRFDAHQCASPFDICVATAYFTGNMRAEERELHALFSGQRVRGEWFRLTRDDLQLIAKRALLV